LEGRGENREGEIDNVGVVEICEEVGLCPDLEVLEW